MSTKLSLSRAADFIEFQKEAIEKGIHQRFEDQVRQHPRNIAIKTKELAATYAQVNGFANSIAAEILTAMGTELSQAAILLPNTPEIVYSMLGAWKAHKAIVPLDPNFPKERLRMMLEDSESTILLTDDKHMELAEELVGSAQITILNIARIQLNADLPNPDVQSDPMDRAIILYTSGSTGRPKGMASLHRNLLHTTMCLTNRLFFSPSDRVTWLHSASFSASFVDLYCCLCNGGTLYPWDAKSLGFTGLAEWIDSERVTTFQWIPSAFRQFLRTVPDDFVFQNIRMVVMASEPLTVREVDHFRQHFPVGSHLVNQLGTSESYNYRIYAIDHDIPIENANVAGGYAVHEDRQVVLLDENRNEVPLGEVGEIGVTSDYMSAGYWRDESLTSSKFVHLQEGDKPVYLTGDIGKLEPDGCLLHLGRKDFQVKIRGYRVELAEVDHVLSVAPGIVDSVAWVVKSEWGDDQLVGYVVLAANVPFDEALVEKYMKSRLPDYMVPMSYVVLSVLPTLPTGKVDRSALPNPFERADSISNVDLASIQTKSVDSMQAESVGRADSVQDKIVGLYEELLQTENLTSESDFVKLGGNSLLTAFLLTRIHQWYDVEISMGDFFEAPTPARLAVLVTA